MNYEVRSGISCPAPQTHGAAFKYPFEKMAVNSHIIVPKSERLEADTDRTFRNRVGQSVRTYTKKTNEKAHLTPGYDEKTYVPVSFSVVLLGNPPAEHPDAWESGDIGIWRDS